MARPQKTTEQKFTEYEIELCLLMKGYSIRKVAAVTKHSTTTIWKLKSLLNKK